jgi:hypothetical protein
VRWLLIHLYKASGFAISFIEDFYALLELKVRGWVNLAQFALRWSEATQEGYFWVFFE